jgi:hypothetical protein
VTSQDAIFNGEKKSSSAAENAPGLELKMTKVEDARVQVEMWDIELPECHARRQWRRMTQVEAV